MRPLIYKFAMFMAVTLILVAVAAWGVRWNASRKLPGLKVEVALAGAEVQLAEMDRLIKRADRVGQFEAVLSGPRQSPLAGLDTTGRANLAIASEIEEAVQALANRARKVNLTAQLETTERTADVAGQIAVSSAATSIALAGLTVIFWQRMVIRRMRANECINCGYDLRHSPDRCPECGIVPYTARVGAR